MLVTKESSNTYAKSQQQQQHMWDRNQIALKKYEEVYNQSLVLTCISMKPDLLIPKIFDSSSLCSLQMILGQWSIQQHNTTSGVLPSTMAMSSYL